MVPSKGVIGLLVSTWAIGASAETSPFFTQASNDSLLWGPYRSNLYFGVRPRIAKSVSTGLLWSRVEDFQTVQNQIRYTCEQHEGMDGYGWESYDPRLGGVQVVHDKGHGIDLETSFVKFDDGKGGWAARIKGTPRDDADLGVGSVGGKQDIKTAVWFTVSVEGIGSIKPADAEANEESGYEGDVVFDGKTSDLGEFKLTIVNAKSNAHPTHPHESYSQKPLDRTYVHSFQLPEEHVWQTKCKTIPSVTYSYQRHFLTLLDCSVGFQLT